MKRSIILACVGGALGVVAFFLPFFSLALGGVILSISVLDILNVAAKANSLLGEDFSAQLRLVWLEPLAAAALVAFSLLAGRMAKVAHGVSLVAALVGLGFVIYVYSRLQSALSSIGGPLEGLNATSLLGIGFWGAGFGFALGLIGSIMGLAEKPEPVTQANQQITSAMASSSSLIEQPPAPTSGGILSGELPAQSGALAGTLPAPSPVSAAHTPKSRNNTTLYVVLAVVVVAGGIIGLLVSQGKFGSGSCPSTYQNPTSGSFDRHGLSTGVPLPDQIAFCKQANATSGDLHNDQWVWITSASQQDVQKFYLDNLVENSWNNVLPLDHLITAQQCANNIALQVAFGSSAKLVDGNSQTTSTINAPSGGTAFSLSLMTNTTPGYNVCY